MPILRTDMPILRTPPRFIPRRQPTSLPVVPLPSCPHRQDMPEAARSVPSRYPPDVSRPASTSHTDYPSSRRSWMPMPDRRTYSLPTFASRLPEPRHRQTDIPTHATPTPTDGPHPLMPGRSSRLFVPRPFDAKPSRPPATALSFLSRLPGALPHLYPADMPPLPQPPRNDMPYQIKPSLLTGQIDHRQLTPNPIRLFHARPLRGAPTDLLESRHLSPFPSDDPHPFSPSRLVKSLPTPLCATTRPLLARPLSTAHNQKGEHVRPRPRP